MFPNFSRIHMKMIIYEYFLTRCSVTCFICIGNLFVSTKLFLLVMTSVVSLEYCLCIKLHITLFRKTNKVVPNQCNQHNVAICGRSKVTMLNKFKVVLVF